MMDTTTICYQGKKIVVQHICEVNTVASEGMDYLLRDADGHYYLRRELYDEDPGNLNAWNFPARYNYRYFLHRISLAAAILWQTDFGAKRILRLDAGKLLKSLNS